MKVLLILLLFVGCASQNATGKSNLNQEEVVNNFNPNEAYYWINVGINARSKKDFTPSLYAFNRGLGLSSNNQEKLLAHQGIALLLLEFRNVEEAKIHYEKVLELSKKNKDFNLKKFTAEYELITKLITEASKI
jgi:tetratricopeptide (TPR) repeat protein